MKNLMKLYITQFYRTLNGSTSLSSVTPTSLTRHSPLLIRETHGTPQIKKLAASSMLHEAKIAYYAFDVIQFFVPYAARLKLRGRVAR